MIYFYFVALANIGLAYLFFTSRVKKNQVVYDPVFVKYKLNQKESKKIKVSLLIKALLTEDVLEIYLQDQENMHLNLSHYPKEDQISFESLLNSLAKANS